MNRNKIPENNIKKRKEIIETKYINIRDAPI